MYQRGLSIEGLLLSLAMACSSVDVFHSAFLCAQQVEDMAGEGELSEFSLDIMFPLHFLCFSSRWELCYYGSSACLPSAGFTPLTDEKELGSIHMKEWSLT